MEEGSANAEATASALPTVMSQPRPAPNRGKVRDAALKLFYSCLSRPTCSTDRRALSEHH